MQRQLDFNERHRNESEKEMMGLKDQLSGICKCLFIYVYEHKCTILYSNVCIYTCLCECALH
jgi:hypothetical protein